MSAAGHMRPCPHNSLRRFAYYPTGRPQTRGNFKPLNHFWVPFLLLRILMFLGFLGDLEFNSREKKIHARRNAGFHQTAHSCIQKTPNLLHPLIVHRQIVTGSFSSFEFQCWGTFQLDIVICSGVATVLLGNRCHRSRISLAKVRSERTSKYVRIGISC